MSGTTLAELPKEILQIIFFYVGIPDICNLMLTCRAFNYYIVNDNTLWKLLSKPRVLIHKNSDTGKCYDFSNFNHLRVSSNWCKGIYKHKILLQHHNNYMPWLTLYNSDIVLVSEGSKLLCLSADKRYKPRSKNSLWKIEVPIVKRNDKRTNDISRFVITDNLLLCGNRDGCAALYEMNNVLETPHLLCHIKNCHDDGLDEISAVEVIPLIKPCVITGSISSTNLHFTQLVPYDCYSKMTTSGCTNVELSSDSGVRCLSLSRNNKLAIGPTFNSRPMLFDVASKTILINPLSTLNFKQSVRDLRWHNENNIIYVTQSGHVQMMDVRTNELVYNNIDPFQCTLYCVKSDGCNTVIVGTAEHSRSVLFDIRRNLKHVQMFFSQKKSSPVYSLDYDLTKLVVAADRSVVAFNFTVDASDEPERDYSQEFLMF